MNILILTDAYWPDHTGGISKCLLNEVEPFVRMGHRCTVLTRSHSASTPGVESREGYDVYRYPSPPKGSRLYYAHPFLTVARVARHVERLHRTHRFDAIYSHSTFVTAALARMRNRPRLVWCFHAPAVREIGIDAGGRKYGAATPVVRHLGRWVARHEKRALDIADALVIRSEFMASEARTLYADVDWSKLHIVPLGVDTERFAFNACPAAARGGSGLPPADYALLTVRRLVARMGIDRLIDAVRALPTERDRVRLFIGGRGYQESQLKAQADRLGLGARVEFLGFIPEADLPQHYAGADAFVLPTVDLEGFGLVTIEALSCGTPVLATPAGANAEVVGPLGAHHLTADATAEALRRALESFVDYAADPAVRSRCRAYCVEHFERDHVARAILDLIAS